MKLALILATLTLAAPIARAKEAPPAPGSIGYVDIQKAVNATAIGKDASAAATVVDRKHQAEIRAAGEAIGKAKPGSDRLAAEQKAQDLEASIGAERQQVLAPAGPLFQRAFRLLPKLGAAHRVDQIVDTSPRSDGSRQAAWVNPKLDFTDELTKRLDAGEGKTDEEAQADLQKKNAELAAANASKDAEIAALKADKAALTKPAAPSVPPPPPIQPSRVAKK